MRLWLDLLFSSPALLPASNEFDRPKKQQVCVFVPKCVSRIYLCAQDGYCMCSRIVAATFNFCHSSIFSAKHGHFKCDRIEQEQDEGQMHPFCCLYHEWHLSYLMLLMWFSQVTSTHNSAYAIMWTRQFFVLFRGVTRLKWLYVCGDLGFRLIDLVSIHYHEFEMKLFSPSNSLILRGPRHISDSIIWVLVDNFMLARHFHWIGSTGGQHFLWVSCISGS